MISDTWIKILEESNYQHQIIISELIQLVEIKEREINNIRSSLSWRIGNGIINTLTLNFFKN